MPHESPCWLKLPLTNSEYSLEGLMPEIQYFDHLMQTAISLEKILVMGKIEGRRRREVQRMWWFDDITHSVDMSLSKLWKTVKDREAWSGAAKSWAWLNDNNNDDQPGVVCLFLHSLLLFVWGLDLISPGKSQGCELPTFIIIAFKVVDAYKFTFQMTSVQSNILLLHLCSPVSTNFNSSVSFGFGFSSF